MPERLYSPIIEPPDPTPILDPFRNQETIGDAPIYIERMELAFSEKQRQALLDRDGHKCQFPERHRCGGGLQLHHILPQRYCEAVGIPEADYAENGITLCKNSHLGMVHPDMGAALANYGRNPGGISEVFTQREEKLRNKQIYWEDKWDRTFTATAVRNTQKAEKKGWIFPEVRHRNLA